MYGLVQWNRGGSAGWLWCFPIALLIIFSYQMLHLFSVLYHSIGEKHLERK
jgi:hypothetical protein